MTHFLSEVTKCALLIFCPLKEGEPLNKYNFFKPRHLYINTLISTTLTLLERNTLSLPAFLFICHFSSVLT